MIQLFFTSTARIYEQHTVPSTTLTPSSIVFFPPTKGALVLPMSSFCVLIARGRVVMTLYSFAQKRCRVMQFAVYYNLALHSICVGQASPCLSTTKCEDHSDLLPPRFFLRVPLVAAAFLASGRRCKSR